MSMPLIFTSPVLALTAVAGGADAAYVNLSVTSVDTTVILDPDNPSPMDVTVHRVWANFTDPDDALFVWGGGGALGDAVIRNLNANGTGPGSGFLNHAFDSGVLPPNSSMSISDSDSYFTINVTRLNEIPAGQGLYLLPVPDFAVITGTTLDLSGGGGAITPPTTNTAAPNPISLAGFTDDGDDQLRILLMQLVVPLGERVSGTIGVTINAAAIAGGTTTLQDQPFGHPEIVAGARPDFNGDGFADIAIGVPGKNHGSVSNSGAAVIMYGNTGSINGNNAALWDQNTTGIPENSETDDAFGSALTWGDFDGDGFDDLAIGVPGESIGSVQRAGAVHVIYGHANQITPANGELWHQDRPGVADDPETGDLFGSALAHGDFNGDGYDDLAIGVSGERVGSAHAAGAVHILYGSADGLRGNGSQFFTADSPGIGGAAHADDQFGTALVAGDFDGDGFADLAIGIPFRDVQNHDDAGAMNVLYGSADGLSGAGSQYWNQGSLGVGGLEPFDRFGSTIAVGDFNDDGMDDLAVAATYESVGAARFAGAVNIIYGSLTGLTNAGAQVFDASDVIGDPRDDDHFGEALACGDLDGDGFDELIIGTPSRKVQAKKFAGAVGILHGTAGGLDNMNAEFWSEARMTLAETIEEHDRFGAAVFAADFNGDGIDDLAVGVPGESLGNNPGAAGGAVVITLGTRSSIEQDAGLIWGQSSIGQTGAAGDDMGAVMPK